MENAINSIKSIFKNLVKIGVPGIILFVIWKLLGLFFEETVKKRITANISVGTVVLLFCVVIYICYLILCFLDRNMRKRRKFFNNVASFVNDNSMQGIQFFSSNRSSIKNLGISYSVTYLGGYVKSDVDTNCMINMHYCCRDTKLGEQIEHFFLSWKSFWDKNWPSDEDSQDQRRAEYNRLIQKMVRLYEQLQKKVRVLVRLKKLEIDDSFYFYYRALQILAAILNDLPKDPPSDKTRVSLAASYTFDHLLLGQGFEKCYPKNSSEEDRVALANKMIEIEDKLMRGKRTGLLGTILYGMPYSFNNLTNPSKIFRRYYCAPIDASIGKNIYAVGIFERPKNYDDEGEEDLIQYKKTFDKLQETFQKNKYKGVLS